MKVKVIAILLSLLLVAAIGGNVYEVFARGVGFLGGAAGTQSDSASIIAVALLAIISASDFPARIREWRPVRVQLQCAVVWLTLALAAPYLEEYLPEPAPKVIFAICAGSLAVFSLIALLRPRDLFSI